LLRPVAGRRVAFAIRGSLGIRTPMTGLPTAPMPASLHGRVIESEFQPNVSYRLERRIGEGGMGQAFLALRHAPDGISPVVLKLVRPTAESGAQHSAGILVQKEAVA